MAVETTPITSEGLQSTVRRLLPSQQGFGSDLEATNLIQPIIDLTPTAEGSQLPELLRNALDSTTTSTGFVGPSTTTIVSGGGFYKCVINATGKNSTFSTSQAVYLYINDGSSDKNVWFAEMISGMVVTFDQVLYVPPNGAIKMQMVNSDSTGGITVRKIADVYGNLQNPSGFTFE